MINKTAEWVPVSIQNFKKFGQFEVQKLNYLKCSIIRFDAMQRSWIEIEARFGYIFYLVI
jgi:hypothetical protein